MFGLTRISKLQKMRREMNLLQAQRDEARTRLIQQADRARRQVARLQKRNQSLAEQLDDMREEAYFYSRQFDKMQDLVNQTVAAKSEILDEEVNEPH